MERVHRRVATGAILTKGHQRHRPDGVELRRVAAHHTAWSIHKCCASIEGFELEIATARSMSPWRKPRSVFSKLVALAAKRMPGQRLRKCAKVAGIRTPAKSPGMATRTVCAVSCPPPS